MANFVIFSLHRSGTSVLCNMLGHHPEVLCHYEIFHPKAQIQWRKAPGLTQADLALRQSDPDRFLARIFGERAGKQAVGFKMWRSQAPQVCEKLIQRRDVHKIILERQNVLARYSSHLLAHRNRVWGTKAEKGAEIDRTPLDRFDRSEFRDFVRKHRGTFKFYKRFAVGPRRFLSYEQLSRKGVSGLLPFLDVSAVPIDHGFQKLHSSDIIGRFAPSLHGEILDCLRDLGRPEWVSEHTEPPSQSTDMGAPKFMGFPARLNLGRAAESVRGLLRAFGAR